MEKTHDLNMLFNTSTTGVADEKEQSLAKQATELKELKYEMRRLRNVMDRYRLHESLLPDTYDLSIIYDGILRALRSLSNLRSDVHYESTDSGVAASNDNSKDLKLKFILRSADDRRNRGNPNNPLKHILTCPIIFSNAPTNTSPYTHPLTHLPLHNFQCIRCKASGRVDEYRWSLSPSNTLSLTL